MLNRFGEYEPTRATGRHMTHAGDALIRLAEVMRRLRAPDGCPWDQEQDLRSLRPYLIEEAYEVLEEMDAVAAGGPWEPLKEELGDLLFQIVFHSQLAAEKGHFDLGDVADAIAQKLTRRHPHVFGERTVQVDGAAQVLENWAKLKAKEREAKHGRAGSVLDGVPTALPALQRAERLTEKASRIGFDWPDVASVRAKVTEELAELDEAIASGDQRAIDAELGDTLFALANLARHVRCAPEDALRGTLARFISRFHFLEAGLAEQRIPFGEATLAQMDSLWNKAKDRERQGS